MTAAASASRAAAKSTARPFDRERWRMGAEARTIVFVSSCLLLMGLAVLYSASAIVAQTKGLSSWYFLVAQGEGAVAGAIAFMVAAKFDADRWRDYAWPLLWIVLVMLLATLFVPESIAPRFNGSKRFLYKTSVQPSELGKFVVVVWTSMLVVKKGDQLRRFSKGIVPFLVVLVALAVLVAAEPDLSVVMLYALLMALLLFAGGARLGHFFLLAAMGLPVLFKEIQHVQYAVLRLTTFLDPGTAPASMSYQLRQSLLAVGSGGLTGVGFGQGRQQYGFLPYQHSDFIASNVGEEWGFIGLVTLTLMFGAYALFGFRIARSARSQFTQLLAVGLTFTTVLTAYLHIGVVVGLLPTTGLTLPFVSFGRSNLVLTMFLTGVLVNIGSVKERVTAVRASNPLAAPA
ncbi:MAG TPA: putative peptidoglycan glycosyltransferase FtsW [Gemmatimonadaceae bacterium]